MSGKNRITVAVLSYQFHRHWRAKKIARTLVRQNIKVKAWGSRKPFKKGSRLLRGLLNYLLAIFEVLSIKADVYWIENVPDIIYLPIPLLGRRYVYDRRSPWSEQLALELPFSKILYRVLKAIELYLASRACVIATASTGMAKELATIGKPIVVIPNYPERSFLRPPRRDIRKELGIPSTRKIVLFVGTLSKIEGVDLLPLVLEGIKDLDAELWILGDGPLRNLVKKLEKNNPKKVRWFGWVPHSEVPDYIHAADLCVVPRHKMRVSIFYSHEGIHKITEYIIYGKPVIASGIAPSPYYIVVEPDSLDSAVRELLEKIQEFTRQQKQRPGLFWEDFSEKQVLKVLEKIKGC